MALARQKLLDAALSVIRAKGYAATSVDELCARAGVAKGSFFRHFKDKEALAVAAAEHTGRIGAGRFSRRHLTTNTKIRSTGCLPTLISVRRS